MPNRASAVKKQPAKILWRLHDRVKSVGGFRAFIISIIFPEFAEILGDLSELGAIIDKDTP